MGKDGRQTCAMCGGSGTVPIHGTRDSKTCPNCNGTGRR